MLPSENNTRRPQNREQIWNPVKSSAGKKGSVSKGIVLGQPELQGPG
jgi:hypothetical protein